MPDTAHPRPMADRPVRLSPALPPEPGLVADLAARARLSDADRAAIAARGADLVRAIRGRGAPGLMESVLAEYGLSTDEGIALMCLAEALLRVPDAETMDALIEDKIAPSDWGRHLGQSASSLVNASTWALLLTGRVLDDRPPGLAGTLRAAVRRLGEPVIRTAIRRAMREMGNQFVLGETIQAAMARAARDEAQGVTFSYDMLGEAARAADDAAHYLRAYESAIDAIAGAATRGSVAANPGISVKLSALHPRYEEAQRARVLAELAPRLAALMGQAARAGIGLNVDAEEQDRLELSLDVVDAALRHAPDWPGFGLVVQAYGRRAGSVIDWAASQGRRMTLRLVKGAYWDAEVKRAQVEGLADFPVFTAKSHTDVSYLAHARTLLGLTDRLYPQFATHNAHTVAAVLHMADGLPRDAFEFQRLHGMGEALHDIVRAQAGTRLRVYAPVGAHRDLLAYLVRRLLENGANSSFVNQVVDEDVPPEAVAADPFAAPPPRRSLPTGETLFAPDRRNSRGRDLADRPTLAALDAARAPWRDHVWGSGPRAIHDPATGALVGHVTETTTVPDVTPWTAPLSERARVLRRAADLYEANEGEILALLARESGKTLPDAVGELREAVDFLRYYATEAERLGREPGGGLWACIAPWNFPLAIFTGQVAAALAMGNGVIAKPAPQTPLIAGRAVDWLHEAGVPRASLALMPGGAETGRALVADPGLDGVAFTGSTATALAIRRALANGRPGRPLIAETGGINAMLVDSTALPEQAVRDIVTGAFRSAGQRCSALRLLLVQEDVAEGVLRMLSGAMAELEVGAPWDLSTDVGPVIDADAKARIDAHVAAARAEGRLLAELPVPATGTFVAPAVIRVPSVAALDREIFGPVLHVATFAASGIDAVIDEVNATGYGLTFGLHSRIDDRVQRIVERVRAGNVYVNRNQIGAVVGSQPFGGEGLSGTGPKAGGPLYLTRFAGLPPFAAGEPWVDAQPMAALARRLAEARAPASPEPLTMPGPTGESNRLSVHARAPVLCLGPGASAARAQAAAIRQSGGVAVEATGTVDPTALLTIAPLGGVVWWGDEATASALEQALADRDGPIVPLIRHRPTAVDATHERHVCIDTTAAGGNATLLAGE